MNILIINHEFPPLGGGGGVASYDLAIEWAKEGRVDVLTSSFRGLKRFETVNNINIYRIWTLSRDSRDKATFISMLSYLAGAVIRGFFLIRKNRYDVINTHFAVPAGPAGYILGRLFRIPNILSLHGGDIYDPSKKMSPHKSIFWRGVVKFILNRADKIIAQSTNTRDNAIKYYNPSNEITIIPLAFHPPEIKKTKRDELGFSRDDFIIVTIGRLVKRKALDLLIRAVGGAGVKNIKLVVIGDGPEKEYLERLAGELGLVSSIIFTGFVDEVTKYRYLSIADLFAMTSLHEGFGIVFMEAMQMGLPILATNHGGQTDFLKNRENALLIEVGDVDACITGIKLFIADKTLRIKCSKNNIEKIKEFYAGPVAGRYMKIFNTLSDK